MTSFEVSFAFFPPFIEYLLSTSDFPGTEHIGISETYSLLSRKLQSSRKESLVNQQ